MMAKNISHDIYIIVVHIMQLPGACFGDATLFSWSASCAGAVQNTRWRGAASPVPPYLLTYTYIYIIYSGVWFRICVWLCVRVFGRLFVCFQINIQQQIYNTLFTHPQPPLSPYLYTYTVCSLPRNEELFSVYFWYNSRFKKK